MYEIRGYMTLTFTYITLVLRYQELVVKHKVQGY